MLFTNTISYYYPPDVRAFYEFQNDFQTLMRKRRKKTQPLVVVCIGTDRATGDCLGPLVGQYLQDLCISSSRLSNPCTIYGCLSKPVHAQNLHATIEEINALHEQPFIIAIDACLGCREHVGYITLSPLPLLPGKGVSKNLPPIGNISITGIVNHTSHSNEEMIQNTRLQIVVELASFISSGIGHLCFPH